MSDNNVEVYDNLTSLDILEGWASSANLPVDHVENAMQDLVESLKLTATNMCGRQFEVAFGVDGDGNPDFAKSLEDPSFFLRGEANEHFTLSVVPLALNALFNEALPNTQGCSVSRKIEGQAAVCTVKFQ